MKRIMMITKTEETVTMGDAGRFKTGIPISVENDCLADALINRAYPRFREACPEDEAKESAGKPAKKSIK